MKFWWISDPVRFAREKREVEALVAEGWFRLREWTDLHFKLAAVGDITVEGNVYAVRLVYADQFPQVPAWVEPVDPDAKWSNHQYGSGGSLCLELRPDNWTPSASGADVLRSAHRLLRTEDPLGTDHAAVESAHRVGGIQSYLFTHWPALIGGRCFLRLLEGTCANLRALRSPMTEDGVWPIYIFDDEDVARGTSPPPADPYAAATELQVLAGRAALPDPVPEAQAELLAALGIGPAEVAGDGKGLVMLAIHDDRATPFHCLEDGSVHRRKIVIVNDALGQRSGQPEVVGTKRLGVVGCGSVGSKVAESLVRSGVRHLLLVDGDIFLPGNLERHTLDWRDVGHRKVNAMKRRLQNIAPAATITVVPSNLNWQRSAASHSEQLDALASCDVILDATGDVPTGLFLGAIASENSRPFVSVAVYEGGLGALIARSVPGLDLPYGAGRQAYVAYCEERNVQPPTAGQDDYEAVFDGTPTVADDAAVTAASGHATRIALDVLKGPAELDESAWLLLGFRKGWLFDRHGHNIMLNVNVDVAPVMPSDEVDVDVAVRRFALDLARKALDAVKDVK